MLRVVLPVPDRSWLGAEDGEELDTVATGGGDNWGAGDGKRLSLLRARGVVRAVLRMRPACVWIGESGTCWRCGQTHLAREEAIKAVPAVGNDHRARRMG
jgi:hypothetical protein